jgi:predicted transcriptional regulator of viral defense system
VLILKAEVICLKYYKEFLELQCFTRADAERMTGNAETAGSLLTNYQKNGYIDSVKRNLYVAMSLETKQAVPNRYRIASHIADGAYISHHSAFEYYGCANQVFYEVYVSGDKRFTSFEYDDIAYRYVAPRLNVGVETKPDGVCVTDMERTVLDNINDFEKIGGLEELLRCLELIPRIDEKKLLEYLEQYGKQFLYQKTGYILNHLKDQLRLSDSFFEICERKVSKSVRYFYNGIEHEQNAFDNRWQLFVPKNLSKIVSQGGELYGSV